MTSVVKRSVLVLPTNVNSGAFHSILGKVKSVLGENVDNEGALFRSLSTIMQVIEESDVNSDKKQLAENVLKQLVLDADMNDEKEKVLLNLIETDVIGNTIDLVVSASKGEITLNAAAKQAAQGCFRVAVNALLNRFCVPTRRPATTTTKLTISPPATPTARPATPAQDEEEDLPVFEEPITDPSRNIVAEVNI